jgi:hypothetical protein
VGGREIAKVDIARFTEVVSPAAFDPAENLVRDPIVPCAVEERHDGDGAYRISDGRQRNRQLDTALHEDRVVHDVEASGHALNIPVIHRAEDAERAHRIGVLQHAAVRLADGPSFAEVIAHPGALLVDVQFRVVDMHRCRIAKHANRQVEVRRKSRCERQPRAIRSNGIRLGAVGEAHPVESAKVNIGVGRTDQRVLPLLGDGVEEDIHRVAVRLEIA